MDFKCIMIFLLDFWAIASALTSDEDKEANRMRLFRDLFSNYEPSLIPAEQVNVTLGLELINIVELNEVKEYLDIHCILYTDWTDKRLRWNSSEYGLSEMRVLIDSIWRPDISLYDGIQKPEMFNDGRGFVMPNGGVIWIPAVRILAKCKVDVKNFPFDTQTCTMKFGSWIHSGNSLDVQLRESVIQSAFEISPELRSGWQIVNSSVKRDVIYYKCCPEHYPSITFTLTLKRSPVYYVNVYILPAVLLSLLVPLQLFLPPKSKERITIGTGLIIANIILVLRLQDVLPDQHLEIPRLGMFYSLNLTWSVLAVLTTILVLNIHNRGSRQGRVPESLRSIFLRSLKSIVCLGDDTYYPFTSSESVSMKGLENPSCVPDSPGANNPSCKESGAKTESSMVKEVEYIGKQVNLLTCRSNLQEGRDDIQNEWMQLALVLDRVFFFFFFLSYLIYALVIMA